MDPLEEFNYLRINGVENNVYRALPLHERIIIASSVALTANINELERELTQDFIAEPIKIGMQELHETYLQQLESQEQQYITLRKENK